MPDKLYRIRRGRWIVEVRADSSEKARYKTSEGLRFFKETGRKPSGVDIKQAE